MGRPRPGCPPGASSAMGPLRGWRRRRGAPLIDCEPGSSQGQGLCRRGRGPPPAKTANGRLIACGGSPTPPPTTPHPQADVEEVERGCPGGGRVRRFSSVPPEGRHAPTTTGTDVVGAGVPLRRKRQTDASFRLRGIPDPSSRHFVPHTRPLEEEERGCPGGGRVRRFSSVPPEGHHAPTTTGTEVVRANASVVGAGVPLRRKRQTDASFRLRGIPDPSSNNAPPTVGCR